MRRPPRGGARRGQGKGAQSSGNSMAGGLEALDDA